VRRKNWTVEELKAKEVLHFINERVKTLDSSSNEGENAIGYMPIAKSRQGMSLKAGLCCKALKGDEGCPV